MFQHWGSQLHYPQDTSLKIRGLTRPDKSWTKINNENVQALGFASQLRVFWRNLRGLYAESRESQTEAQHQLKMHMEKLNFIQLLSSLSIELEWTVKADRFEICFCTQWKDLPFPKKRPGLCKTSSPSGIASYDSKSRGLLPEAISMVINGPKHPWIKKELGWSVCLQLTYGWHICSTSHEDVHHSILIRNVQGLKIRRILHDLTNSIWEFPTNPTNPLRCHCQAESWDPCRPSYVPQTNSGKGFVAVHHVLWNSAKCWLWNRIGDFTVFNIGGLTRNGKLSNR